MLPWSLLKLLGLNVTGTVTVVCPLLLLLALLYIGSLMIKN